MADVPVPDWLRSLPLAPEYRPSLTEFSDPIAFISRLEHEASAFGICKVIPPFPKPPRRFVLSNLHRSLPDPAFTTRTQELGSRPGRHPLAQKHVWQSGQFHTLDQFEAKSRAFARAHLRNSKDPAAVDVEALFWKAAAEKPIYVDYANDVPGSGFGAPDESVTTPQRRRRNGAFDSGRRGEGSAGWKLSNSPWNLQVIARAPGSITRFMPDDVPGVTSPMVYIGMLFSWFAWHVEDHELHSLNFLHMGAPKTWYAVPGSHASALEEVVRVEGYGCDVDRLAAFVMLGEKRTLLSPEVLVSSGVPCCRLVQNPGEFVVTFPRAYHVGFSHGFNCGEAANFATSKWLNVAKEAAVRRAAMNYLPMLSHQQLLYLLAMSFISRVPREFLPGARCSRLRDRRKEERELVIKKAFMKDIVNERKLLDILLGKSSTVNAILWDTDMLPCLNAGHPLQYEDQLLQSSCVNLDLDGRKTQKTEIQLVNEVETVSCNTNQPLINNELQVEVENGKQLGLGNVCPDIGKKNDNFHDLKSRGTASDGMKNFFDEDEDLPCGIEIDSSALTCVACGILGYPFMSIIQPSDKAFMSVIGDFKAEDPNIVNAKPKGYSTLSSPEGSEIHVISDIGTQVEVQGLKNVDEAGFVNVTSESVERDPNWLHNCGEESCTDVIDRGTNSLWNLSNQAMRPRIFCLQHAIEVEEKLQRFGGAHLLIICHTDYPKIKSQAMSVEDVGIQFLFEDIPMENASRDDLDLINISIDDEKCRDLEENDWTSKMGLNLNHFVRCRKTLSPKHEKFCLSLDGLFLDTISRGSALKWQARRARTIARFNPPYRSRFQAGSSTNSNVVKTHTDGAIQDIQVTNGCVNQQNALAQTIQQEDILNISSKPCEENGDMLSDILETGDGERSLSCSVFLNKNPIHEKEMETHCPGGVYEVSDCFKGAGLREGPCNAENSKQHDEMPMHSMFNFNNLSWSEVIAKEISASESMPASIVESYSQLLNNSSVECSEISEIHNPSGYIGSKKNPNEDAISVLTSENGAVQCDLDLEEGSSMEGKPANDMITVCDNSLPVLDGDELQESRHEHLVNCLNSKEPPIEEISTEAIAHGTTNLSSCQTNLLTSHSNPETSSFFDSTNTPQKAATISPQIKCYHRRKRKPENGITGFSSSADVMNITNTDTSHTPKASSPFIKHGFKRKRELDYLLCSEFNIGSFVRSPCEGLRARGSRSSLDVTCNRERTSQVAERKRPTLAVTRSRKVKGSSGSYACVIERCRMKFSTEEELTRHQRNYCTHNGCGKHFLNHRYTVRHQRVHNDDRPLKCLWEGCNMTFKWDWARTEHLRVHTGERPYKCSDADCRMTFRYVSDFSRHRRKTGHSRLSM